MYIRFGAFAVGRSPTGRHVYLRSVGGGEVELVRMPGLREGVGDEFIDSSSRAGAVTVRCGDWLLSVDPEDVRGGLTGVVLHQGKGVK